MKKLRGSLADYARPWPAQGGRVVKLMVLALALAPMAPVHAADWFVTTNGSGDGSSWANATNSIQGAINASFAADTVWVSNGVYEAGGVTNFPTGTVLTNRVAIYKAITVRSADNNPTNTIIRGAWNPTTTNGPAAVRCVWMTNGSALIGFTLTNGATLATGTDDEYGGGVYCQSTNTVVSNCVITGNSAYWVGGGAIYGTLFNCTLNRNSSTYGGGAYYGTLYNCTLTGNSAVNSGGGSYFSTLNNCTLTGNSAVGNGGGARGGTLFNCTLTSNSSSANGGGADGGGTYDVTLSNCTLTANSAQFGGGAIVAILYNCTLTGNSATGAGNGGGGVRSCTMYNCTIVSNRATNGNGGGAEVGTLYNCTIVGNQCLNQGGGASGATLYDCTIVGNSAGSAGGVFLGTLYNCISWGNNTVDAGGTRYYSCGAGYTNGGSVSGNITNDPLFIVNGSGYGTNHVVGNYRLRGNSPCINAGTNFAWMTDPNDVRSKDLDGQRRINGDQVDMGCYEFMRSGTMFTIQ